MQFITLTTVNLSQLLVAHLSQRHGPCMDDKFHHAMTHNFISQLSTAHLISLSQFLMAHLSQRHGPCMDDKFHPAITHRFYITGPLDMMMMMMVG